MRIAIAYPPLKSDKGVALLTQNRQFQWFSHPTYIFPVVPATAATMLKNAGHDVLFLDGIAAGMTSDEFDAKLKEFAPEIIVVETKTPVVKRHWKWIEERQGWGAKFVMVGDHVTALPQESVSKPGVWAIIPGGDWDYGLLDFLEARCPSGVQPFALRESLKDSPWIDRDLVHWELYAVKNGNFRRTPGTYIMSGRDCWHAKCTFCSWTTLYPKYRTRDPIDVVNEIENLVEKYGVKEVMDDSGSFPVGTWLKTFCDEMIKRGLNKKVRIDCNMRFGRLTKDDYVLMRRAGFQFVLFGIESANQETLDRYCKALKVEDVESGARWASEAGLDVHVTFMFGHPWEGPSEIANTVALARRLLAKGWAKTLQCTLTIPYPGTPLFKELQADGGLLTQDWDEYDMRRAIMKTPLASEAEIKCAIREVYRGFLQFGALWHRLTSTRTLFDLGFYFRGVSALIGHLLDFRGGK
ncbi:MAG: B12-binding domain-containing radical SAM protein [Kiritimatiellae bacterium]|nr:B12-binding domain-containing radical SAM protein [Kiritimatiellia bacterium]